MGFILRDYQQRAVDKSMEYLRKKGSPKLLVAPVAAGKALIISSIANLTKTPCLVIQPSVELLHQNLEKLHAFGGDASVCSASDGRRDISELTYATLGSVKNNVEDFRRLGVKTLLIDEADRNMPPEKGSMFRTFIDQVGFNNIIGLTATPFRLKRYSVGDQSYSQLNMMNRISPKVYNNFIDVIQVQEMLDGNYWADITYEEWDFDTSTLKTNSIGSEYTEKSISRAVANNEVNKNIAGRISRLIKEGKSCLAFVDSVENAKRMAEILPKTGVLSSDTKDKDRTTIIKDFKSGKLKAVINYGVLSVGFDYPALDVVIIGRPTMSYSLIYQWIGRVVRNPLYPAKKQALVIDFCNNIKRFGKMEDLSIHEIPSYGWGAESKGKLLTGIPIGTDVLVADLTKPKIAKDEMYVLPFGKYSGRRIDQLPKPYAQWLMGAIDDFDNFLPEDKKTIKEQLKQSMLSVTSKVEDDTKLVLVDVSNVAFSLFSRKKLNSDGYDEYIDGVENRFGTTNVISIKDARSSTYWRKKAYPEYKENRKDKVIDPKFIVGINDIMENCDILVEEGMEADDIIARQFRENHLSKDGYKEIYVLSSDSDFNQLGFYKTFRRADTMFKVSTVTQREAIKSLVVKVLKGDSKDNIKKCHNQHQIRTTVINSISERVFKRLVDYCKKNVCKSPDDIPLGQFIKEESALEVDIDPELFDLNMNLINLIQTPKI